MNAEFFEALAILERERGIQGDYLLEKIKNAIVVAVRKDYGSEDNVEVTINPEDGAFEVAIVKDVVEEVEDEATQITAEGARKINKKAKVGEQVKIKLDTKEFGRIAAITAKHVIRQGIREAERSQLYADMQGKTGEIVSALVTRVDPERGSITVNIGKGEAMLPKAELVPGENLSEGEHIKVYVAEVAVTERGPRVMISRTHPGLVRRMFELEVPELFDGTVEMKAISREAGSRTKIAVYSKDENVDPVGACIGPRGARVENIVKELHGEKIDIIRYSEDAEEFIAAALAPASVVSVEILPGEGKSCRVTVPDNQLSLAIGNKGQNARLTARLTGYNIDIRPESGYFGEEN